MNTRTWTVGALGLLAVGAVGLYLIPLDHGLTLGERQKVIDAVRGQLDDPFTAVLTMRGWAHVPKLDEKGHLVPLDPAAWKAGKVSKVVEYPPEWYCGFVNAKNRFGAYTGKQFFAANVRTGTAFIGDRAIMEASIRTIPLNAEMWCTDSLYTIVDGKSVYISGFDKNVRRPAD